MEKGKPNSIMPGGEEKRPRGLDPRSKSRHSVKGVSVGGGDGRLPGIGQITNPTCGSGVKKKFWFVIYFVRHTSGSYPGDRKNSLEKNPKGDKNEIRPAEDQGDLGNTKKKTPDEATTPRFKTKKSGGH